MDKDIQFVSGMYVKEPHEKVKHFVRVKLSVKREELIAWLDEQEGEWVNMDVKESKQGKLYVEVNDWKPTGDKIPVIDND